MNTHELTSVRTYSQVNIINMLPVLVFLNHYYLSVTWFGDVPLPSSAPLSLVHFPGLAVLAARPSVLRAAPAGDAAGAPLPQPPTHSRTRALARHHRPGRGAGQLRPAVGSPNCRRPAVWGALWEVTLYFSLVLHIVS